MISGVFRIVTSPISYLSSKLTGTSKSATEWSGKQSTKNAKNKRKNRIDKTAKTRAGSNVNSSASQPKADSKPKEPMTSASQAQSSTTPATVVDKSGKDT